MEPILRDDIHDGSFKGTVSIHADDIPVDNAKDYSFELVAVASPDVRELDFDIDGDVVKMSCDGRASWLSTPYDPRWGRAGCVRLPMCSPLIRVGIRPTKLLSRNGAADSLVEFAIGKQGFGVDLANSTGKIRYLLPPKVYEAFRNDPDEKVSVSLLISAIGGALSKVLHDDKGFSEHSDNDWFLNLDRTVSERFGMAIAECSFEDIDDILNKVVDVGQAENILCSSC